jgi:hypothetical protein
VESEREGVKELSVANFTRLQKESAPWSLNYLKQAKQLISKINQNSRNTSKMSAAIKMDELLVTWLSSDAVYENVLNMIETYRSTTQNNSSKAGISSPPSSPPRRGSGPLSGSDDDAISDASPRGVATIPPFYRPAGALSNGTKAKAIRKVAFDSDQSWDGIHMSKELLASTDSRSNADVNTSVSNAAPLAPVKPIKVQVSDIFNDLGKATENGVSAFLTMDNFVKITKEICSFPTFFNGPLYKRILYLWNTHVIKSQAQRLIIWNEFQKEDIKVGLDPDVEAGEKDELLEHLDTVITKEIFKWYWIEEMEDFDASERFFRLLKKPFENYIGKDDFLPYMKELLRDHPVSLSHILLFLAIVLSPLIFASILL